LVETSNNIASAAFNFFYEGKLKESEAKDYASKNLMLNVRSIFAETMKGISASQLFHHIDQSKKEKFTSKLQKTLIK